MSILKLLRIKHDLTMEQMAEKLGVSPAKYRLIENGEQTTTRNIVSQVSSIFGMQEDEIFLPVRFTVRDISLKEVSL